MAALPRLLLAIAWLGVAPAFAQTAPTDPHRPTSEERRWLQRCLDATPAEDPAAARARCAGRLTAACLGLEGQDTPRITQPEGRNSHPRSCAPIEAALWDAVLNRWYQDALDAMPAQAQDTLRRSQRAWIGYRDANCATESLVVPGFLGQDLAADCRLDMVTTRALEIRGLASLARENR